MSYDQIHEFDDAFNGDCELHLNPAAEALAQALADDTAED